MGENVIALVPKPETAIGVYTQMTRAIADCVRVDDVKQILDKAAAIEEYARRAGNFEPERQAAEIRIRCERRAGELLKALQRAGSNRGNQHLAILHNDKQPPSPYAQAIVDNDLNYQTANRYQQLAAVPEETFEAAVAASDKKPTTAGVLRAAKASAPAPLEPVKDLADIEITDAEMDRLVDPLVGVITGTFFTGLGMPGHPDFPAVVRAVARGGHRRARNVRAAVEHAIEFLTAIRTEMDRHE